MASNVYQFSPNIAFVANDGRLTRDGYAILQSFLLQQRAVEEVRDTPALAALGVAGAGVVAAGEVASQIIPQPVAVFDDSKIMDAFVMVPASRYAELTGRIDELEARIYGAI